MVSTLTTRGARVKMDHRNQPMTKRSNTMQTTPNTIALPTNLEQAFSLTRGGQFCFLAEHENKDGFKCASRLYQTGFSYKALLQEALADLANLTANQVMAQCRHCDTQALAQTAIDQQKASWERSLDKIAKGTLESNYTEATPGVLVNANNPGRLYVRGLLVREQVIWRKDRPATKHRSPLTPTKAWIKNQSRISDYKNFSLTPESNFKHLALGGRIITPADITRYLEDVLGA